MISQYHMISASVLLIHQSDETIENKTRLERLVSRERLLIDVFLAVAKNWHLFLTIFGIT